MSAAPVRSVEAVMSSERELMMLDEAQMPPDARPSVSPAGEPAALPEIPEIPEIACAGSSGGCLRRRNFRYFRYFRHRVAQPFTHDQPSGFGACSAGFTSQRLAGRPGPLAGVPAAGRRTPPLTSRAIRAVASAASTVRPSALTRTSSTEMVEALVRLIQAMILRARRSAGVFPALAKMARATGQK